MKFNESENTYCALLFRYIIYTVFTVLKNKIVHAVKNEIFHAVKNKIFHNYNKQNKND